MTAAHILVCLTQEQKSIKQIAREDFNNNLELVLVWADYMVAIGWIYNSTIDDHHSKWVATDNGKKWLESIIQSTKRR